MRVGVLSRENSMYKDMKQHCVSCYCGTNHSQMQWLNTITVISHGFAYGLVALSLAQMGSGSIPCVSFLWWQTLACLCHGINRGERDQGETCTLSFLPHSIGQGKSHG